jgi:hypothetical protein
VSLAVQVAAQPPRTAPSVAASTWTCPSARVPYSVAESCRPVHRAALPVSGSAAIVAMKAEIVGGTWPTEIQSTAGESQWVAASTSVPWSCSVATGSPGQASTAPFWQAGPSSARVATASAGRRPRRRGRAGTAA